MKFKAGDEVMIIGWSKIGTYLCHGKSSVGQEGVISPRYHGLLFNIKKDNVYPVELKNSRVRGSNWLWVHEDNLEPSYVDKEFKKLRGQVEKDLQKS